MTFRNTTRSWGALSKALHWLIVLLIINQWVIAARADSLPLGAAKLSALSWHKSFGMTILALAIIRLVWRWMNPVPTLQGMAKSWERALAQLAQRHEVVAVRVLDPLELDLPDLGLLTLRDAETGEQLVVDTHDAGFRKRFARIAAQRESELREALTRSGVDALELSTDAELVDAIVRFVDMRKRRSQLSAGGLPAHLRHAA